MKLKKIIIMVEPLEATNKRWLSALKGKISNNAKEEIITISDLSVLGKIFSAPKLEILHAIINLKPQSIASLAKAIKRDFKNTNSDVKFLADLGLIELKEEGPRKTLIPLAKYSDLELKLVA